MARRKNAKEIYDAAAIWRGKCLLNDGSLFGDDSLWTKENFSQGFVEAFDSHKEVGDFISRLSLQMQDMGPVHCKLAAEILWVMYLTDSNMTSTKKIENMRAMTENMQAILEVVTVVLPVEHDLLQKACLKGIGKPGPGYGMTLWFEMICFILCVREIKSLARGDRERLLVDSDGKEISRMWDAWPEKWRTQWTLQWWNKYALNPKRVLQAERCQTRHMFLHVLFPDYFEPVFSGGHKNKIVRTFKLMKAESMSWSKKDEIIQVIRKEQEKIHGVPLEFYRPPLYAQWHDNRPDNTKRKVKSVQDILLNQIFYGPPGTGKTYRTVTAALEILDNKFYQAHNNDRKALKDRFDQLKKEKRVGMITFHQSFGYEEFVEGIRPVPAEKMSGSVSYDVVDGVFKNMCAHAYKSLVGRVPRGLTMLVNLLSRKVGFHFDPLSDSGHANLRITPQRSETHVMSIGDALHDKRDAVRKELRIHGMFCDEKKVYIDRGNPTVKKLLSEASNHKLSASSIKNALLSIDHSEEARARFGNRRTLATILPLAAVKQAMAHDVAEESLNMHMLFRKRSKKAKPHVLIIDEINRGNISRIFGELITLIEGAKRLSNEEATTVTLPYSLEEFGVPNNLYIIGTMNTADRSIALLDTALRRRFRFVEMMPDLDLLKHVTVGEIKIAELLKVLNQRIEVLYDRDHQIGHSYFLRLKKQPNLGTLTDIFQHEVLPLLQEYFYDDWEKIDLVLNKNGFLKSEDPPKMSGDAVVEGKKIWSVKTGALKNAANYQKIYANAADDNPA